jgi:hypothetical protein
MSAGKPPSGIKSGNLPSFACRDSYCRVRQTAAFCEQSACPHGSPRRIPNEIWSDYQLSEVYLIYTTFRQLALLPSSCDWLSFGTSCFFILKLVVAVEIEAGTLLITGWNADCRQSALETSCNLLICYKI